LRSGRNNAALRNAFTGSEEQAAINVAGFEDAPEQTNEPQVLDADADGSVARRHRRNRGGGEDCGYAASLGQRKRVAHIPTAAAKAARSGLIFEGQGGYD